MASLPRVLGIITARGGSKGIPGKNVIKLGQKPLIQYTVEAAKASKLLDRFILSTDCDIIARVAMDSGCEVPFMRPVALAHDTSAHMDCIKHALQTLSDREGYNADFVMILQPTSPFRTAEDIDSAISIVMNTSCDAVMSVSKSNVPLTKTFHVDEESNQLLPYAVSMTMSKYNRRQDCPRLYSENGAIYIQRVSSVLTPLNTKTGSLLSEDVQAYIMPIERSLDVDEPYDLEMARALIALRDSECTEK
jgi:CMP-N-acetylneuraminic acid synthetase